MKVAYLTEASLAIQIHLCFAVLVIVVSLIIVFTRKGTKLHKVSGRIWACLMMGLAIGSFWINSFNMPYGVSPIHILSVITIISVPMGIYHIRSGNVRAHKRAMTVTMIGGVLGAGIPAVFIPGRVLHSFFFGA